jgi:hypothetical protein
MDVESTCLRLHSQRCDGLPGVVHRPRTARLLGALTSPRSPGHRPARTAGRSFTVAQADDLPAAGRGHPLDAAVVVDLTCGLRPGELLALA